PTLEPTGWPSSAAMRAARARAAMRRGWVCAIRPSMPRPDSRQYCGNWVLLPEPVSPATISTGCARSASRMASRREWMGRSASRLNTSCAAPRAAARRSSGRSLATLDFLPEPLLCVEVQVRENQAALRRQGFHAAKAPLEFRVRRAQSRFGVDIELARQIRGREQQVADLLADLTRRIGMRALRGRLAYLGEFFGHFVGGLARVFEIKADAHRPFAQLEGAHQGGKRLRNPVQMTARRGSRGIALARLDVLPRRALLGDAHRAARAEHMRMTPQQLVADGSGHRLEIELPRLAGDLRVEHHLKQQIAQFVLQVQGIAALDGGGDLVGLLDGVRRAAGGGLLPIPGTAVGGPQARHDGQQFLKPGHGRAP